jgi:hypothetical protein
VPKVYHPLTPPATPDRIAYLATLLAEAMRPDRPAGMTIHAATLLAGTARREGITYASLVEHLRRTDGTGTKADPVASPLGQDSPIGTVILQDGFYIGWPIDEIAVVNRPYVEWLAAHSPNAVVRDVARAVLSRDGGAK